MVSRVKVGSEEEDNSWQGQDSLLGCQSPMKEEDDQGNFVQGSQLQCARGAAVLQSPRYKKKRGEDVFWRGEIAGTGIGPHLPTCKSTLSLQVNSWKKALRSGAAGIVTGILLQDECSNLVLQHLPAVRAQWAVGTGSCQ